MIHLKVTIIKKSRFFDKSYKAEKVGEQYDKTVKDLSQALEDFTDKAEDVAKFVICSDLNNYIEPVNKKPSGPFGTLKEIWNTILGKDAPIKNNDIRNFANDKLFTLPAKIAFEYLNVAKKISDGVNLENRTASKQKEDTFKLQKEEQPKRKLGDNRMRKIKRPAPPPPPPPTAPDWKEASSLKKADLSVNKLKPELQEKLTTTGKKVHFKSEVEVIPSEDSGYESSEHEYETSKALVPKETLPTDRERQKPKVEVKNKPKIPPKPKNLGHANQKVSTKPKVVGVILKKPTVPLKSENQDHKQSVQKAVGKAIPQVAAMTMKEGKMVSKVKAIREKFEQNLAKENANVRPAESKTTPAAQEDKRSQISLLTVKSDPKHASKNPLLTHVNVKQIAAQFEKGKGERQ